MASVYSAPKTFVHRLWYDPPPSLALEFTGAGVAACEWTPGAGQVGNFSSEAWPDGTLRPSPVRENMLRPDEVRRAAATVLDRATRRRGGNIALLLPDVAARVSVLTFEQFPGKAEDRLPLIRWRLKKTVPFEIDDAMLSYQRQGRSREGEEIAVAVSPGAIVRQYEAITQSLGFQPGFVSLSSLAMLGLLSEADSAPAGTMLLRAAAGLLTIVLLSPHKLRIFRSTELPAGADAAALDGVVRDAYSSAVYFQDNFGEKISRIFLAGFGERTGELREAVGRELGVQPQNLIAPGARTQDEQYLGIYGIIAEQARE